MTTRRALLASAGMLAVAGCTVGEDPGGTTTDTSPTDTPLDTPTGPDPPEGIDADWPMPAADSGLSNGLSDTAGPTEPIHQLWQISAGAALSGPVLADETLYVGSDDGMVRAIDAITGQEHWQSSVAGAVDTPWVIADRLYVPTAEAIVALDIGDDGTERWRTETPDRVATVVTDHGIYWVSGPESPTVVALAGSNGEERWRTDIQDPWAPQIFDSEGSVFVSTGTNSNRPWTLDPQTGEHMGNGPEPGHDFPAERFHLDGSIYCVDPFFGMVRALKVAEGGHGWSQGVDGIGDYAISGGSTRVYYIANGGESPGLYALSRESGSIEWTTDTVTAVVGRPAVTGECVLVRSDESLHCFDPTDGTERWSRSADGIGEQFIVADDLLFTTHGETLRAFRPR